MALDASFYRLADAVVEWLDNGNYTAFSAALEALDTEYFEELDPLDRDEPKDTRIVVWASRYAAATKALGDFRLVGQLIESRRELALAELIATVAEPSPVPVYWQKLVKRIQAEGIVQPDVHPSSRALAKHLASAIRDFNVKGGTPVDETYSDMPIAAWADLPHEFAGFRLIDINPDDRMLGMRTVHALPPSTDIADYTVDRVSPPTLHTREATYERWMGIIEGWAQRKNQSLNDQEPAIWAMLLAHRMPRDNSKVEFFNRQLIESPWQRGATVMIEVVEDDLPDNLR